MKMRTLFLVPASALIFLGGCSMDHHPGMRGMGMGGGAGSGPMMGEDIATGSGPMMGSMGATGQGMGSDMTQMCAQYRDLTAGKSSAEQQAAIEQRMQSMNGGNLTPEQLRMRREMMERNCAGATGTR